MYTPDEYITIIFGKYAAATHDNYERDSKDLRLIILLYQNFRHWEINERSLSIPHHWTPFANHDGLTLITAWIYTHAQWSVGWNYVCIPKPQRLHLQSLRMDE